MSYEQTIKIPGNVNVVWTITSQADFCQGLIIKDPKGKEIVNTSVLSNDMSNVSYGTFQVPGTFKKDYEYNVQIDPSVDCKSGNVNIRAKKDVVASCFVFANEDHQDGDFNDAFITITWFARKG